MSASAAASVWGPVDAYRAYPINPSVPIGLPEQVGVPPRVLDFWRRKGWLGDHSRGPGYRYPWHDTEILAQVDWLKRLALSGRVLDDEDAAAGFRLRALDCRWAVRVGRHRWWPLTDIAELARFTDAYTLAVVSTERT